MTHTKEKKPEKIVFVAAFSAFLATFNETFLNVAFSPVSALDASLTLFPAILLSCVVSPVAGRIYDRHGAKMLLPLGFALICIFTFALTFGNDMDSLTVMALMYIPVICGSALIIGPVQSFALSYLTPELNPHGVTVMSTGFQIAGCIGSSLFAGVYSVRGYAADGFDASAVLAAVMALAGFVLAAAITRAAGKSEIIFDKQL